MSVHFIEEFVYVFILNRKNKQSKERLYSSSL